MFCHFRGPLIPGVDLNLSIIVELVINIETQLIVFF